MEKNRCSYCIHSLKSANEYPCSDCYHKADYQKFEEKKMEPSSGVVYEIKIDNELLQMAVKNTAKLLIENTKVIGQ